MNSKILDENTSYLFEAILSLKTPLECAAFFEDVCTIAEIKAIAQRMVVAKMLSEKMVYSDIAAKTGASTATISRVNRSLMYGADGYMTVLERIEKSEL